MTKKIKKTKKRKKNAVTKKSTIKKHRDVNFLKLLIKLSIKEANASTGSIRDLFLAQAVRLDAELESIENKENAVPNKHGNA
jgi:hypothetical protein